MTMPGAVEALAVALLLRRDDTYAARLLAELEAQGWTLVHLPTVEQAADAIAHQRFDPSGRHREDRDAAAVLDLVRGIDPYWHLVHGYDKGST